MCVWGGDTASPPVIVLFVFEGSCETLLTIILSYFKIFLTLEFKWYKIENSFCTTNICSNFCKNTLKVYCNNKDIKQAISREKKD